MNTFDRISSAARPRTKRAPLAPAVMLAALLAGCAAVPPDQHTNARRDLASVELADSVSASLHDDRPAMGLAREGWPAAQWWRAYHDPQLDALIAAALQTGPSLEVAAARIGSARAELSRSMADSGIELDGYANANRQRYSGTGLFPAPIGGAWFSAETLRLEARYNFDWWGKQRAQVAAAVGALNADRAAYAQAEQALAAAIAQSYFRLQGDHARLANLDDLLTVQTALLAERERRIAHGLANTDARHDAEAALRQLRQQREQLQADVGHEREALRALTGAGPADATLASLQPAASVTMASNDLALPARLGIELLARRPDLQAARWQVEATLSRIEVAQAAFYPDLDLTGSLGLDTIRAQDLFKGPSRTFYLGPTLTLPLFDSRRLDAQLDSARTVRNARIAAYNQAVVEAVRDVAQDALQLQGVAREVAEHDGATAAAAAQLASAEARRAHGLADQGQVLTARLALLRQRDAGLYLQQLRRLAEVALTHALGGGYHEGAPQATAIGAVAAHH